MTESGTLIVNGVKASCYAGISSHEFAHFAMQPLIFWHKISNFLGFTQKKANVSFISNSILTFINPQNRLIRKIK